MSPRAMGGAARITVRNPGKSVVAVSCPRSENRDARAMATTDGAARTDDCEGPGASFIPRHRIDGEPLARRPCRACILRC